MVTLVAPVRVVKAQPEGRVSVKLVCAPLAIAVATVPLIPWGSSSTFVAVMVPAMLLPPIIPPPIPPLIMALELIGITLCPAWISLASNSGVNGKLDMRSEEHTSELQSRQYL